MNQDTICAIATANGVGALGIIRLSGVDAVKIAQRTFKGKNLEEVPSHTVHYGYIVDGNSREARGKKKEERTKIIDDRPETEDVEQFIIQNESSVTHHQTSNTQHPTPNNTEEVIDEVMVSVFLAPKTFTTEDVVEISFHGSPHIAKKILEVLVKNGARLAKAGEFTMRAFMNGRIDLAQAESIADLIASENEASRKVALNQLKGGITNEISILRNDLLNFTSLIELELDFGEEDVEFADRTAMNKLLLNLRHKLSALIESFQYGNALKNGVEVAIIGKPNAGKSTLLNALLKEERAIVSEIAGTTRDTIEEVIHLKGTAFRFVDTAGLRETTDIIEKIGVTKAKEKIASAKVLLYLYDEQDSTTAEVIAFVKEFHRDDLKIVLVHNKVDLTNDEVPNEFDSTLNLELFPDYCDELLRISARDQTGIEAVKTVLIDYVENLKDQESNVIITNQRHYDALRKSLQSVLQVEEAVSSGIHTELLAYELRNALEQLGEISGEFTNDEVLGNIFSKFCIGK
ncbi:tRNA uridine-5-carboxymethylaminomethyl(34) synthesis GTPase MnmE [Chryseobacterium gotjawalense]|uniref:tRNA modification GTPase MnmE n=1 Tax=Chryseobacterium gotjawalense TaxID=3042315 RepID=A0ABY8RFA0_9FLAO|nr:tRNA uridine-5-carboxymethylaminomethyl(34) synthesis GTPase MnmE [Chryseobacterium sp. wdc7]WHF51848.1 tRNA uridine-5-carboxymethylaminomethyl(34) synthesis GTPase MnmE [Chryseobacterium sp. wdc7]